MIYTKVKIFNLALGALLLTKQIIDTDNDSSKENQVLNVHYDTALEATLQDLDLDATVVSVALELIEENPNSNWLYSYKYPTNCTFFRRIRSCTPKDRRTTQIARQIAVKGGIKVIFTNEISAIAEYVPNDLPLSVLSAQAGLAVAYKLAMMSSPLISGKATVQLKKDLNQSYAIAKTEAQEQDRLENATFDTDVDMSEFVEARLS